MEQKTSYTNNSVLEIELSNESELQPNQFDKPPEYDCFSYSLQRKHLYFLLQEAMLSQRNSNDITAEKMLHWQSFPKKKDALREWWKWSRTQ